MNSTAIAAQSPLHQFYTRIGNALLDENAGVILEERPFLSHINLRGDPGDPAFLSATAAALHCELPTRPNTWVGGESLRICWLGPNEWLVISSGEEQHWCTALQQANASRFFARTVLSGGQTTLRLSGAKVRALLAKASTLDFHPRSFSSGQCAQSTFGKAPALYLCHNDDPVYEIILRRSFADYFAHWLEDAAHEFALRVHRPG